MQTIEDTYRAKLRALIKEFGSQSALAKKIGKSPAQISQWVNASKDSKTGKPRSMDRNTARDIEKLTGKPAGWMDQPIDESRVSGKLFEDLTHDEWELLANFRAMMDEDQAELRAEIDRRAERIRSHMRKIGSSKGLTIVAEAHAKRTTASRATMNVTAALSQRSLLDE